MTLQRSLEANGTQFGVEMFNSESQILKIQLSLFPGLAIDSTVANLAPLNRLASSQQRSRSSRPRPRKRRQLREKLQKGRNFKQQFDIPLPPSKWDGNNWALFDSYNQI